MSLEHLAIIIKTKYAKFCFQLFFFVYHKQIYHRNQKIHENPLIFNIIKGLEKSLGQLDITSKISNKMKKSVTRDFI